MFVSIFLFALGAIVGSFLNVCIHRFPRRESIVRPASHCPRCNKILRVCDNIPVLSFLILRGRCRFCGGAIPFRYLIVELLSAAVFVAAYLFFGFARQYYIALIFFSLLIVATFVDFEHREIPDEVTLGGLVIGLVISVLFPEAIAGRPRWASLTHALGGALAGGGLLYIIGFFGEFIFKKEAMGGGDVKLLAMIGAFVGWKLALVTFFIAPLFGSVVGIALRLKDGRETIPYGPYLSLAAVIAFLFGRQILAYIFYGV